MSSWEAVITIIGLAAITVLTRRNIAHVRQIYAFYERSRIPFRILPLFDGAWDGQHAGFEVSTEEILAAFRTLVDLWFESDEFVQVEGLHLHGFIQNSAKFNGVWSLLPTQGLFNRGQIKP